MLAARPASSLACGDSRSRRLAITACTREAPPEASGRSVSITNSGLPSVPAYRRSSAPASGSAPVSPSASRAICSRPSRPSATSLARPSVCGSGDQREQRMGRGEILPSNGGRHEHTRRLRRAQQVVDEAQRLGVGPLGVVGDQQQRRADAEQGPCDRREQPSPQLALGQRPRRRGASRELRVQPRELGPLRRIEPGEPRPDRLRLQPRRHDPVGDRPLDRIRARFHSDRAGAHPQLLHQPGLADPRFPTDDHQLRLAAGRGTPDRGQPVVFVGPSDQRRAGRRRRGNRSQRLIEGAGLGRRLDRRARDRASRRRRDRRAAREAGRPPRGKHG